MIFREEDDKGRERVTELQKRTTFIRFYIIEDIIEV